MKNYINFINESKQLDDAIIQCINDNTYRPLELIPDKEHAMKVILNKFYDKLDNVNFEELIKYKFPLNAKENGCTALIFASSYNNKEIVKKLIGAKSDLNIKNRFGNTALMVASYYNRKKIVKLLIDAGADINLQNKEGKTALYFSKKFEEIIELLKSKGAKE